MDPLAAVVTLLRPRTIFSKVVTGAGQWGVRYSQVDNAGFGLVLSGSCYLGVDGHEALQLAKGDFILMPSTPGFTISSDPDLDPVPRRPEPPTTPPGDTHHGDHDGEAEFSLLGGYFWFDPTNIDLLARLLPSLVHIRSADVAAKRIAATVALITDEATGQRPGRDLIVERLVEVMVVESLRFHEERVGALSRPGLLEGLADRQLAIALSLIHDDVAGNWTVATLARAAGLSRSTFSERFTRKVGLPPMEYLQQWRMAVAKDMLQRERVPLERVATAIGYQSASAFSTAFRREVGRPPSHFVRGIDGDVGNAGGTAAAIAADAPVSSLKAAGRPPMSTGIR